MGDAADKKYAWIQERECACNNDGNASLSRPPITPTTLSALQEGTDTPNFNAYAPDGVSFGFQAFTLMTRGLRS